ncbi:MAG: ComF family protein [Planctomycetota bacterium]|nr:ComF family protein [Planctomycetota bacterium]
MYWSPWRTALSQAWQEALDALWPRRCRLCGAAAEDDLACGRHRLPSAPAGPRCARCAAPVASFLPDGSVCPACRHRPPPWERATVLGDYRSQPVLREWILPLKHGGRRDLAEVLGRALAHRIPEARLPAPDSTPGEQRTLLVPVPLHPWRRLERGHDQARLLALALSLASGIPFQALLRRTRDTPPQGEPWAPPRARNVRDAFTLAHGPWKALGNALSPPPLAGRTVLLVDDVITSGTTAAACTKCLLRAGAERVELLALARAGA